MLDEFEQVARSHTGRRHWAYMVIGALLSAIASDVLTPSVFREIISALMTGLGHLFGHPVLSLPLQAG
jgi:hypothetical protein